MLNQMSKANCLIDLPWTCITQVYSAKKSSQKTLYLTEFIKHGNFLIKIVQFNVRQSHTPSNRGTESHSSIADVESE